MTKARSEYIVAVIGGVILLSLIGRGVIVGRGMVRDDLRRQDITNLKRASEQYFNAHESYVTPPADQAACTTSNENAWFFGNTSVLLREQHIDALPHDPREEKGLVYRYCVTVRNPQGQAIGYTLEAIQETPTTTGTFFDEDEKRKFSYRILEDKGQTFYRTCGGEERQCD